MNRRQLAGIHLLLVLTSCLSGCGKPDYKKFADKMVQKNVLEKRESRRAIEFFEEDGHFFDDEESGTNVDREILLPLLKRLMDIASTEQLAMLHPDDKNRALVLLVELPKDAEARKKMEQAVSEADDRFDGEILQQWGHEWLQMDVVDKETSDFLKEAEEKTRQRQRK